MYFRYLVIISPWKRVKPFVWTNLNPLHPRIHCAEFGWNWSSGSGVEYFSNLSMYFNYFVIKGRAFHMNNLEFDAFCQVWLKLTQWFWRRRWKCEKFMTTSMTDNGQILIRKARLSLRLRWSKKHYSQQNTANKLT